MRLKKPKSLPQVLPDPSEPLGIAGTYKEGKARTGYPEEWIKLACESGGARTSGGRIDLDKVRSWVNANTAELEKLKDQLSLKDQKLVEEIRQLRLKNDAKSGLLVARSMVSECFQRAAGELNSARIRLESTEPVRLAEMGSDVGRIRVAYRSGIDELMSAILNCGKHFE